MGKGDALVFQQVNNIGQDQQNWNIVELESHKQLHRYIDETIQLCTDYTATRSDLQQRLSYGCSHFGKRFTHHLIYSLHRKDHDERQSVVWLLTLLNDQEALPTLRHMAHDKRLPRSIRLSASLTLAGMRATPEMSDHHRRDQRDGLDKGNKHVRLYAIS